MRYKSTVILKDFLSFNMPPKMNSRLAIVDLEHRVAEEWLLWLELER